MTASPESLATLVQAIAVKARAASSGLAIADTQTRNQALLNLSEALEARSSELLSENQKDLNAGEKAKLPTPLLDRLQLTPKRIQAMAEGVRQVAHLPDPLGEILETSTQPNGLTIKKVRVPIGVIGIIYEARPNVTIDCAALCLKSGNAAILRGGREAYHTNTALALLIRDTIRGLDRLPDDAVQLIPTTDRAALNCLLKLNAFIDCIIPRGGEALIRFVAETATIPVIKHYKGVCNLYIDKAADFAQAERLAVNAKCQRPGVCNAIENLFIHHAVSAPLLPRLATVLASKGIALRVDAAAEKLLSGCKGVSLSPATEQDYFEEYLDLILAVKVVPSLEAAIEAVNTYGSGHSDAIVTTDADAAQQFLRAVDSATVYWNASTRFTDGFEFGFGAEIGISTDKLHARGPMGLRELCTYKYLIYGQGQMRT